MEEFDLFVIGAGSGGVRAARVAGAHGARVAIAEMGRLGGTCVNRGCVPKKLLVYASQFSAEFHDAGGFGWQVTPGEHRWSQLIEAKDAAIRQLNAGYGSTLAKANAELWTGRATLVDPHVVSVDGRLARARNILIATGGAPRVATVPGSELAITSDDVFALPRCPSRVLVVGGGYIAMEFACMLHGFGSEVTIVHRNERFLRDFDSELADGLVEIMRGRGIDVVVGQELRTIDRDASGLHASLSGGARLDVNEVLFAVGRAPVTAGMGLEEAGVELNPQGYIVVDRSSRTRVPHIYAVGDVTGRLELAPVAIKEGQAVALSLFGDGPVDPEHVNVPSAVFSQPPIAAVGLTESEARAVGHDVEVFRSRFMPLKGVLSGRPDKTLMKLVVDRPSQRVVGCHMLGPDAPEIMQGLAVAMRSGATKADFDATVGIHPTAAEEFVTMKS